MRTSRFIALSGVSLGAMALGISAPAYAQDVSGEPTPPACEMLPAGPERDRCLAGEVELESGQDRSDRAIIVTGSRIRSPGVVSPVPVTSVGADDLLAQGDVNIGDALNDLPSLRSTFSQANSTRFIGTAGVNLLDLRGLGTSRTLVLVNGRRHVTYTPGTFQVDVNTIPADLLERVDIVTGGSSAVYGSDAIAGVVNFITRRNFEGLRVRGQAGTSSRGDRGIQFVSVTAGENLFDDRLNIAANIEYVNAEPLYFWQRPGLTGAYDGRCQFNLASFTAGEPASGNNVPDNQFFCGVRNLTISNGGTVTALGVSAAVCSNPAVLSDPVLAARCLNPGTPHGQPRVVNFQPDGTACQIIPALDFRPFGSGNYIHNPANACYPGSTLRDTGQLAPGLDRYMGNLLLNYEITPALRPFLEAKFVRLDALQEGQPTFFQSSFPAFFGAGRGIRCDNPFLTAQQISTLQAIGRCLGGPTSTETIPLSRFNVDFGGRRQEIQRDTYRIVGGLQGDFNTDWNYEVAVNYGRSKSHLRALNDLHIFQTEFGGAEGPFLKAIDAVRLPDGRIVCRVNAVTVTDPNCVPLNPFGVGRPTQAALDYVNTTSTLDGRASQLNAVGYIGGNSSQLFELPGGPIRFIVGAEYRREKAFERADALSSAGATFFNAFDVFDPPTMTVKEAFGEVQVPLLRDTPFFRELSVSGAARYSDYNTAADKTFAYNLNATWSPIRDIRFRGNYSQAVRVPTLGDLYQPATQNFAFVQDPCDVLFIGNNPNRAANCAALGVPVGFVNTIARSQTIEFISSGNPFLQEETGKSWTLGGVFTPTFVPGLSLTVDYYRIRVENLIATLGAQTILNQCVDLPSINNQFCQLIFPRSPDGLLQSPALISGGINYAKQEADGIDFDASYRRNFANGHRIDLRGIATLVLKRNNFVSPTDPDFSDRILSELGDPEWRVSATAVYGIGNFDLRYSLNYIGRQTIFAYENYFPHQGRPPQNPDVTADPWYPAVMYHNLRLSMRVPQRQTGQELLFYLGMDNVFDTKPPLGLLGTGAGDPFDSIGRYLYAGATINFR